MLLYAFCGSLIQINKDEKIFVSRFGGDEFFILFEGEEDGGKIENYVKLECVLKFHLIFCNK